MTGIPAQLPVGRQQARNKIGRDARCMKQARNEIRGELGIASPDCIIRHGMGGGFLSSLIHEIGRNIFLYLEIGCVSGLTLPIPGKKSLTYSALIRLTCIVW